MESKGDDEKAVLCAAMVGDGSSPKCKTYGVKTDGTGNPVCTEYEVSEPFDNIFAGNVDYGISDIRPGVEVDALVTLTGTEEITGDGMIMNLLQCTRNTQRTSNHVDDTRSCSSFWRETIIQVFTYIGLLITAIDRGQDMTTDNIHLCITIDRTCRTEP